VTTESFYTLYKRIIIFSTAINNSKRRRIIYIIIYVAYYHGLRYKGLETTWWAALKLFLCYHQQCSLNVYSSTSGFVWCRILYLSPRFIHMETWGRIYQQSLRPPRMSLVQSFETTDKPLVSSPSESALRHIMQYKCYLRDCAQMTWLTV